MTVTKSGRQLVVLANLATTSRRYKQLYTFLDSSTLPVTRVVCGRAYAKVSAPENGSLEAFVRAVRAATTTPETEAVDLVLACHGVNAAIKFTEGKQPLTAIEARSPGCRTVTSCGSRTTCAASVRRTRRGCTGSGSTPSSDRGV